jgi:hypothetical protein
MLPPTPMHESESESDSNDEFCPGRWQENPWENLRAGREIARDGALARAVLP